MFTKKLFNILFASLLVLSLGFVACQEEDVVYVSMAKNNYSMYLEDTCLLAVKVQGAEAGDVKWEIVSQEPSDEETPDAEVIKLDETGKAIALNYGTAKVKATIANGRYALGIVSVIERVGPHAGEFKIAEEAYYIDPGVYSDTIEFSIDPENLKLYPFRVTSSNEDLLTIDTLDSMKNPADGIYRLAIFPKNKQSDEPVIITATLGSQEATCEVYTNVKFTLSLEPLEGVTMTPIEQKSYKFEINNEKKGRDTILVYFDASPNDEATLSKIKFDLKASGDGLVINKFERVENKSQYRIVLTTGGLPGLATIDLKAAGAKVSANCEIYNKEDYEVESVTMLEKEVEICEVTYYDLFEQVEVAPFGITDYWPIEWYSSNLDIATVDQNGRVVFTTPGEVDIFAQAKDKKDNCHFRVLLKVESVAFASGTPNTMLVNEEANFNVDIKANLKNIPAEKYITWESTNPDVASVENGKVVAKTSGKTTIKVTVKDDKGNTHVAEQKLSVSSADDIIIYDITFTEAFSYSSSISTELEIYNMKELEEENFKNYVIFKFDQDFAADADKTYNIGSDLTGKVAYQGVDFNGNPAEAVLKGGTITAKGGVLTFDVQVSLGSKTFNLKGTVNPQQ